MSETGMPPETAAAPPRMRPTRLFGTNLQQTLEPRLFYLRAPFRAQDELPLVWCAG